MDVRSLSQEDLESSLIPDHGAYLEWGVAILAFRPRVNVSPGAQKHTGDRDILCPDICL